MADSKTQCDQNPKSPKSNYQIMAGTYG